MTEKPTRTKYYETDSRFEPLIPAILVERVGNTVTLRVTKSRGGYKEGDTIQCDADRYVEKCGKQSGRFVGQTSYPLRSIYVRPVDSRRFPE